MSWLVQKFVDDLLFMTLIPLTNRTVLYYLAFMLPAFAIFYLERKKQFVGIYIGALRQEIGLM